MKNLPSIILIAFALLFWLVAGCGAYDWIADPEPTALPSGVIAGRLAWLVFLVLIGLQLARCAAEGLRERRGRDVFKNSIF